MIKKHEWCTEGSFVSIFTRTLAFSNHANVCPKMIIYVVFVHPCLGAKEESAMSSLLREKMMWFFDRRDKTSEASIRTEKREEDPRSSLYYVRSHVY